MPKRSSAFAATHRTGRAIVLLGLLLGGAAACASSEEVLPAEPRNPSYDLQLLPAAKASAHRTADGVLSWKTAPSFWLRNQGERSFLFMLECETPWIRVVGPTAGMLNADEEFAIELTMIPERAPGEGGTHAGTLRILNGVTLRCEFAIEVTLTVEARPKESEPGSAPIGRMPGRADGGQHDAPRDATAAAAGRARR